LCQETNFSDGESTPKVDQIREREEDDKKDR